MKLIRHVIVLFSLCGGMIFTGWAQQEPELQELNRAVERIEVESQTAADQNSVYERISSITRVEQEVLRQQRTEHGIGFGSLAVAHLIAQETGQSFEDIVALHKEGAGWGEIAKENGAELGPIVNALMKKG